MPEPELHVRDLTPLLLTTVCDSGRHPVHTGSTCEEIDEVQAEFRAYLDRGLADAYARAIAETEAVVDQWLVTGDSTGAPLGFLAVPDVTGPTPGERAFAILEPHLVGVPLYKAGPPALRMAP